jgi:hypothetical protein
MTIEDYIKSKTTNKTTQSHLIGIVKEVKLAGVDKSKVLSTQDYTKLWDGWHRHTGKTVKAEHLHGGNQVKISQFVDSAIQY